MNLLQVVRDFFLQHFPAPQSTKTYWIGFSGGLDSHVLLALCAALRQELSLPLQAIHVNHGLSPNAHAWMLHCKHICATYDIPLHHYHADIRLGAGESLEACARHARYQIFTDCLQKGDVLLTAHHQDDQAETMLLQLLRGAGLKGLAAMPVVKPFASGWHARPLLDISRALLEQYAKQHGLTWIEDESNQSLQLARNYLRHEVLPIIKSRWPSAVKTLTRSATHCAEADSILFDFAAEKYETIKGSRERTLSVSKLLQLNSVQQRWMLRHWIVLQGYPLPNSKKIINIQQEVLLARSDRLPCVHWQDVEIRRYRDDLYVMQRLMKQPLPQAVNWHMLEACALSNADLLQAKLVKGSGLCFNIKQVNVAYRLGGEKVTISGRITRSLKNLFQEWGVPPWERDRIPLLFIHDKLISVVGYFLDTTYAAKTDELGWEIHVVKSQGG